ncbi:PTS lactose/cellobiose transporter subunit IIA [Bulleidia sp. zg-1006]|nr:PTS lactose/cellobiose transporter subunit IIA [Bulleidia sp. zg-1006]
MEGLERICFQIIASIGEARYAFLKVYRSARRKDVIEAKQCLEEANVFLTRDTKPMRKNS